MVVAERADPNGEMIELGARGLLPQEEVPPLAELRAIFDVDKAGVD